MSKILFLDIDGVLLPSRAYYLPNQTNNPFVTVFDPCAVSLLNKMCIDRDYKIVVHSTWIATALVEDIIECDVKQHLINQGVNPDLFHEDWSCNGDIKKRYDRIDDWIGRHRSEMTHMVVIDDEAPPSGWHYAHHFIETQFDDGITIDIMDKFLYGKWGL